MTEDDDWSAFLRGHQVDPASAPRRLARGARNPRRTEASRGKKWQTVLVVVLLAVVTTAGVWWVGGHGVPGSVASELGGETTDEAATNSELDPIFDREVGDCFSYEEIKVTHLMKDCDELHDAETTSTFQYPGDRMPSSESEYMKSRCTRAANEYLGSNREKFRQWAISWSIPTIQLWDQGYRDTSCIVVFENPRIGSMKRSDG